MPAAAPGTGSEPPAGLGKACATAGCQAAGTQPAEAGEDPPGGGDERSGPAVDPPHLPLPAGSTATRGETPSASGASGAGVAGSASGAPASEGERAAPGTAAGAGGPRAEPYRLCSVAQETPEQRPERSLVFECRVGRLHTTGALLDSGVELCFVDAEWVRQHGVRTAPVAPIQVRLADGRVLTSDRELRCRLTLDGYCMPTQAFRVVPLGSKGCSVILGMTWLTAHKPVVEWDEGTATLTCPQGSVVLRSRRYRGKEAFAFMSVAQLQQALQQGEVEQVYLSTVTAASDDAPPPEAAQDGPPPTGQAEVDALLAEFRDVLRAKLPEGRRPASRVQHHIRDVEGAQPPPLRPPIRMSPHMEQELRAQIERLLENGRIRLSESPYGAPCFLVKKMGKDAWRLVIDYRALNAQTVKWVYPVPSIDEMLDRLAGAKWFTTMDLTDGYHQIEMGQESIHKTGFRTRWGQWEFTCMPFGLCNAPATFQAMMNEMLPKLGPDWASFVLAYLDDLIVFSRTLEEHLQHLRRVLELLRSRQLYCKPLKCCFASQRVGFLGHIVSDKGIEADGEKVAAVLQYPPPRNVRELQTFLGATGWFRRFIPRYAHRAAPLTCLLKQSAVWAWGAEEQDAFADLQRALTEAPVLVPPDHSKDWLLYTDASDVALGAVVLQETDEGPRAVAYLSKTLSPAERNYTTRERECLAIVTALKKWHYYFLGGREVRVYTDHNSLTYLRTQVAPLTGRLARWAEEFARFNLTIGYLPGKR